MSFHRYLRILVILVCSMFLHSCATQCTLTKVGNPEELPMSRPTATQPAIIDKEAARVPQPAISEETTEPASDGQTNEDQSVLKEIPGIDEETQTASVVQPAGNDEIIERELKRIMREFGEEGEVPKVFLNEVKGYIRVFQTNPQYRKFVTASLERSSKYLPLVKTHLSQRSIPGDMAYIAFVESGFNPRAVSRAGAVGVWQFMPKTARDYSLKVGKGIDERTDPVKSTFAAIEYFNDLIAIFGPRSFLLAIAAYNCGEWRVISCLKAIDNPFEERNFWHIRSCLANETREYPPRVIAAAIIGNNPEAFGFPKFEGADDTISPIQVASLNPVKDKTASATENETIHSKQGAARLVRQSPHREDQSPKPKPVVYTIRKGNPLSLVAEVFAVEGSDIKKWNKLKSDKILEGQKLKIYPKTAMERVKYTVRKGDAITDISESFNVRPRYIIVCNGLKNGWNIKAGQTLVFYKAIGKKPVIYTVKKGTTLARVSNTFAVRVKDIMMWNNLKNDTIYTGQRLKIYREGVRDA